jgi:hypothetical protein
MVKKGVKVSKKVVVQLPRQSAQPKRKIKNPQPKKRLPVFGPISTIDTAPVSIGNSVTGSAPVVVPIADGVNIRGRDFLISIDATDAGVTNWTMTAGCPIVPHALVSSVLKSYAGIYANFIIKGIAFHYITACATSVQGDMMFHVNKSRAAPGINFSSSNFMSVVLSDHNTVIGPLWKNHTAVYYPVLKTYSTDILNDEQLMSQGPGELFVFTKTASEQAPGYVLIDYDIDFVSMQVNVKALTFPVSRLKYTQMAITLTATAVTTSSDFATQITGTKLDGTTASIPSTFTVGDIYKGIINITASTLTNVNTSNLLQYNTYTGTTYVNVPVSVSDGFTMYGVYYTTNAMLWYPTYEEAASQSASVNYNYGVNATITINIPVYMSLVGSVGNLVQSNI